jgi:neutral ceramidase
MLQGVQSASRSGNVTAGMNPAALLSSWFAGVAKVAITPQAPMWLSGYAARTRAAEGKLHELWCKALALMDGRGKRCVLVTLDLVGVDRRMWRAVQRRVLERYHLGAEAIRLACSHTHTGPIVGSNLAPMYDLSAEQLRFVQLYEAWLEERIVETVGEALRKLAPASLEYGSGTATFAVNRRNNKEVDVPGLQAAGKLQGPVDHEVPVLRVKDATGNTIAVAFGYACHATVLDGYQWSGDYPGFAQLEIEKAVPGAVALFWAGCGGDQNPLPRRKVELAEKYGKELAAAVLGVLEKRGDVVGGLQVGYAEVPLAFSRVPTEAELRRDLLDKNKYVARRARLLLNRELPLSEHYPYPVQVWKVGDGPLWIGLGGEVVVDYALRLKRELGPGPAWVNAYANDVMAYIPSERVLQEGRYEGGEAMVYYGLPAPWRAAVEETVVSAVRRLATSTLAGSSS